MQFNLTSRDNLLQFEADPADIIRQSCEVKNKAADLIDILQDYPDSKLVQALRLYLAFLEDSSRYFADVSCDRVEFFAPCFTELYVRFTVCFNSLDDMTRYHRFCVVLRQQGFLFRSLYFSCRSLDEMLSQYFRSWAELHPDYLNFDFTNPDYPNTVAFQPLLPDIVLNFPSSHLIL